MAYENGAMSIELATLELLRTRTSVPVPTVDFADRSRELCDADYFFMPFIDADNLGIIVDTLPRAEREASMEQLGALNHEINFLRGENFGPPAGPGDASWRRVFTGMVEDVLVNGERRGVGLGWDYDVVRATVAEHADSLDEVNEPRLVERDLWDSDVMVRDGEIVCIIDHERAFYGDPLIEAGFTGSQMAAFGDAAPFIRGYGHGELTGTQQARRRLYCLYLVLVMAIETVYRGHTDTKQYGCARLRIDEAMSLLGLSRR